MDIIYYVRGKITLPISTKLAFMFHHLQNREYLLVFIKRSDGSF